MTEIAPIIEAKKRRTKKRKKPKEWLVGYVGPGLSPGVGFGNPVGGDGGGAMMGEAEDKNPHKFSCAMLNISEKNASVFEYWAKKNISEKDISINEDDVPHVTVKYGLHDTKPDKLKKILKGVKSIKLKFGKITKFDENPNFDVLKVDVESKELEKLNKKISKEMDHTNTFSKYKPHITLAYVKKGKCKDLVGNDFFTEFEDEVDEIFFTSKTGEDYFIKLKD
jgi:2'-5' RNA ligase